MRSYSIQVIGLLISFMALSIANAEDWPEFRGPTGQGVSTAHDVPVEWDSKKNIAWQQELPGVGWSSPVVVENRIYLTTAVPVGDEKVSEDSKYKKIVETPYSLRVMCLDLDSGKTVWNTEVSQVPEAISIHPKNKSRESECPSSLAIVSTSTSARSGLLRWIWMAS